MIPAVAGGPRFVLFSIVKGRVTRVGTRAQILTFQ